MLPRENRLTDDYDFRRVRRLGRRGQSRLFSATAAPAKDSSRTRFGFVASLKFDKRAARRNRARRLLRAAVRSLWPQIKPGYDVVVVARPPVKEADFEEVCAEINKVLSKISLL